MAANSAKTGKRRRGPGRPFQPGKSGNPSGRPKRDRGLITALEEIVDRELLAAKLYTLALYGDMTAIKYIYDRIEGTPTQRHEFSIEDFVKKMREQHPSLTEEQGNVIARRAQEFWLGTG